MNCPRALSIGWVALLSTRCECLLLKRTTEKGHSRRRSTSHITTSASFVALAFMLMLPLLSMARQTSKL
jgi:hypothetical protein